MKDLGELLKQKRQERSLSLKEVENATSIRMSYLQAIEEGDMSRLISPVYAQGFVKQYATFLGSDGDELIQQFKEVFDGSANQYFEFGIGTLEKRGGSPGSSVSSMPNLLYGGLFLIIVLVAWYVARYLEVW